MSISGYYPKRDNKPKEPVKLIDKGKISISKPDGADDGFLVFKCGNETDGTFYRIVVSILMVASIIAIAVLIYLLLRSLF